jgi:hypothetical protein
MVCSVPPSLVGSARSSFWERTQDATTWAAYIEWLLLFGIQSGGTVACSNMAANGKILIIPKNAAI